MYASSAPFLQEVRSAAASIRESRSRRRRIFPLSAKDAGIRLIALIICAIVVGCGGYFCGLITELSGSSFVIDAGQSLPVTATVSGSPVITWSLAGSACSAGGCGTLSNQTANAITYTGPSGISSPIQVTLVATVTGTTTQSTASITVNPLPTISGTLSSGTVGAAYRGALTSSGGTAPLKWSIADGSLPPGLSFNTATGAITGTPTTPGSYSFKAQIVDSSYIPYTATAQET